MVGAEILVMATPTWLGKPSSVAQRVLERMDAMLSELNDSLIEIGFTAPGQNWTYWNRGPGPGDDYKDSEEGGDWSHSTARAAAGNVVAVAKALAASPIPPPQS